MNHQRPSRRGITLLEVLIAIGILAIGLSSVVSLVPAGRSQAARAVLLDRAAALAANVLADAATCGLLREGVLTAPLNPGTVIVVDPAATASYLPAAVEGRIRGAGIFSGTSTLPADQRAAELLLRATDDVLVADPPTPDDVPFHLLVNGSRAFQGRMTALVALAPHVDAWRPGRLSAVVFHNRDAEPTTLAISGTLNNFELSLAALPAGRTFRDIVKPGSVIFAGGRFHQIVSANAPPGATTALVTLSTGATLAGTHAVAFLPDSVGLAERMYTTETGGAFAR
jgi:prepilin-type N-terminal cleavage/methylation domain-containing protein